MNRPYMRVMLESGRCRHRPYIRFFLLLVLFLIPDAGRAIGEVESENGDYSIEATGSSSFTRAALHFPDLPELFPVEDEWLLAAAARLILEGKLGPRMNYEMHFYSELSRVPQGPLGGAFATAGSAESPYRYENLSRDIWKRGQGTAELGIDRFVLDMQAEPFGVSVGRMPVNFSVTHIFAPNDFFAPFSAAAINTIYKPGVDALRAGLALGALSSLEVVGVMGYDAKDVPAWEQSALIARAGAVFSNFEWAALGGKLAGRWVAGASIQGEAGPIGLRSEGHAGFGDGVYGRVSAGLDASFTWRNASVGAEYMFASNGAASPSDYLSRAADFYPDDIMYVGRHYAGARAGMDLIPILRLNAMGLLNALDLSGLAALTLAYNILDELDLNLGALIPWGGRPSVTAPLPELAFELNSEYGAMPFMAFLETRFYF